MSDSQGKRRAPEQRKPPARQSQTPALSEAVIFCTLVLLGGGLIALITLTDVPWFFPALFYGVVVYVAWQKYL
jgi:Na+/glutamate symporter